MVHSGLWDRILHLLALNRARRTLRDWALHEGKSLSLGTDYLVEIMQRKTSSLFPLDGYNCCIYVCLMSYFWKLNSSYLQRKIYSYALEYCMYEYDSHLTAAVTFAAVLFEVFHTSPIVINCYFVNPRLILLLPPTLFFLSCL